MKSKEHYPALVRSKGLPWTPPMKDLWKTYGETEVDYRPQASYKFLEWDIVNTLSFKSDEVNRELADCGDEPFTKAIALFLGEPIVPVAVYDVLTIFMTPSGKLVEHAEGDLNAVGDPGDDWHTALNKYFADDRSGHLVGRIDSLNDGIIRVYPATEELKKIRGPKGGLISRAEFDAIEQHWRKEMWERVKREGK